MFRNVLVSPRFHDRLCGAGVHSALSVFIALLAAIIVFMLWYPAPYDRMAGGRDLFLILVSVDVVIGPLLTFVVFDLKKPRAELIRDITIIALLQLAALGYGMHTVFIARPIALVFETDRFRVVAANQVLVDELPKAQGEFNKLSIMGPRLMNVRRAQGKEVIDAVDLALRGYDTGQRPTFWIAYEPDETLNASKDIATLLERYPAEKDEISVRLQALGATTKYARFVPVLTRAGEWIAIVDTVGQVSGFLPYDGF